MKAQFYVNGRKITIEASKDTLSDIAGMACKTSNYCRDNGHEDASEVYDDWFNGLFDALNAKGYYNSVKD